MLLFVQPSDPANPPVRSRVAQWAARLDRGLSPVEQDAYLQWLRDDAANGRAIAQVRATWRRLDGLIHWRPAHGAHPNPDLLAPKRRRGVGRFAYALAALACCLAAATIFLTLRPAFPIERQAALPQPDRRTLPDGSQVELNHGAKIDLHYSDHGRVVHLLHGEAHFTVAKDPAKPFLVVTKATTVRATGTAFTTHVGAEAVSVLVTEGSVRLERADGAAARPDASSSPRALLDLSAGEEGIVRTSGGTLRLVELKVREQGATVRDGGWAWRTTRLYFNDLPLREVVAELNRFSIRKLVIGEAEIGDLLIGGNFNTGNPEAFARSLVAGMEVETAARGPDIVLLRRR